MNWHARYAQQARWSRDLRAYVFNQGNLKAGGRALEVGCGTGAILSELPIHFIAHGLDLDNAVLGECQVHAPAAFLTRGDAISLPYADNPFDLVYCHFLLLWVPDPLQAINEMKRVAKPGGIVAAFAEPDYFHRIDKPEELVQLGMWQTEALKRQGADPGFGSRLAESFFQAGIDIVETGSIQGAGTDAFAEEWDLEWSVIESDLAGAVPGVDLQKMKDRDKSARAEGRRTLHVPTYFAWGTVSDS